MALMLLGELALMRSRFTTDFIVGLDQWWSGAVRLTRFAVPWSLCVLLTIALIGHLRLAESVQRVLSTSGTPRTGARAHEWAGLHVTLFALFFVLTLLLLEATPPGGWLSVALPLAWVGTGAGVAFTLLACVFPPQALLQFARSERFALASGLALGTATYAIGERIFDSWPFWRPMAHGTLVIANAIVGLFTEDRICIPEEGILGTPSFPVHITKFCSGYEGISLFAAFFTVFLALWRHRLRFPHALLLLPVGIAVVWLCNAVRIAALIGVGTAVSPDTAIDGFHVYAGWPIISAVALGAVTISTRVRFFTATPVTYEPAKTAGPLLNPAALYVGPFVAIVATAMITGSMTANAVELYPVRILVAFVILAHYRHELGRVLRIGGSLLSGAPLIPVAIGAIALLPWMLFEPSAPEDAATYLAWQSDSASSWIALWWVFQVVGTVIVAPLAEELAFRGFVLRRLIDANWENVSWRALTVPSLLISSIIFGALHANWLGGVAAGLCYAYAQLRRGRLRDAFIAHATTNALLVIWAASTGSWWHWF